MKCLVLTDGWYSLPSTIQLGTPLYKLVEREKVALGVKLNIQGAELVGDEADQAERGEGADDQHEQYQEGEVDSKARDGQTYCG